MASASLATEEEMDFTSFEPDQPGRWTFPQGQVTTQYHLTGTKSFQFSATTPAVVETTLSPSAGKPYVLSFWSQGTAPHVFYAQGGSSTLGGGVAVYSSTAIAQTGWTCYSYLLTEPGRIVITNSSTANSSNLHATVIDEVRVAPKESTIVTYTYDAFGNKISESDRNSRIAYFQYDSFHRPVGILDEAGNLVKSFEYNTKQ